MNRVRHSNMKMMFRNADRINREVDEIERLLRDNTLEEANIKYLRRARKSLLGEHRSLFRGVLKEQGDRIEKSFESHGFKGLYGYGRRFGVNDLDKYVRSTMRSIRTYFATGYIRGYRAALKDSGELDW